MVDLVLPSSWPYPRHTGRAAGGGLAIAATRNAANDLADSLSVEAKDTILTAMNKLPDDIVAYVLAYTPVGGLRVSITW